MSDRAKAWVLSVAVLGVLALLGVVLPEYYQTNLARILVLATFAMGYNLLFGYMGLLSLGHALFFAAGLFAMGLTMRWAGIEALPAFLLGVIAGGVVATLVGALALRTEGVAFMIVTLMLAQAGFLTVLYFSAWTNGDEGFVIQAAERQVAGIDLTQRGPRF
ncbi:MAG: branched-chain amino acid ABC transporter permease, partial [Pseudomonadota bacterium]